jgi:hypothetical protein
MAKLVVLYGGLVAALFFVACSEDEVSDASSPGAEVESTGSLQARLGADGGIDGGAADGGVDGGADGGETTSD